MDRTIQTTFVDGVTEIEISRRHVKNALDASSYKALADALADADRDSSVRVVLIRGQEDLFCSGNDLGDFLDPAGQGTKPALSLMDAVNNFSKPLIAAVGGPAIGLGTTLLYHCDVVYATPQARFGMPFVPLGVCPEFGTSLLAPFSSGHRLAAEAILFGEVFDAKRAQEMGLINQVVEPAELFSFASRRAAKLASLPPYAVQNAKAMLKERIYSDMHSLFRRELHQFDSMLGQPETRSQIQAFLDRKTTSKQPK